MQDYGNDADKYPGEAAIKILAFGVLLGSAGYFSGTAIARKAETIFIMLGLTADTTKGYDTYYTFMNENSFILSSIQFAIQYFYPFAYWVVVSAIPVYAYAILYLAEEGDGLAA